MIGRKRIVGYGVGMMDAENDAFERLNGFVINNGFKIVDVKTKDGQSRGAYWCEVDVIYEYSNEYEEE